MLTRELNKAVAEKLEMTEKDVAKVVDAVFETMTETMKAGNEVNLNGFGKFMAKVRPARTGRNPRTGASVEIPEKRNVAFRPAHQLRTALNS